MAVSGPLYYFSRAAEPAAQNEARTAQQVILEFNATAGQLKEALPMADFKSAAGRATAAPKAVPVLKKMVALLDEIMKIEPGSIEEAAPERMQFLSMLTLLGDADAAAMLVKQAQSAVPAEAASAKAQQALVQWWSADGDATKQSKAIDDLAALAKQYPTEDTLARTALTFAGQNPANKDLAARAQDVILNNLTGPYAQAVSDVIKAQRKLAALIDKPLAVKGITLAGQPFSTEAYKGKVVLVDFWATWCVPCLIEMPRVKKIYQQYHPKGFEIVGVSSDKDKQQLQAYLGENPDMTWTQLYDPKIEKWHHLAEDLGVTSLPTMFLIDRKGVVRSVDASDELETLLPKLLDEKAE